MPTANYFGRNALVQFKKEDTWGTAKTGSDLQRPIISCSMLRQIEKVERPNLQTSGVNGLRKGHFIAKDSSTGSLTMEATYDNLNPILKQVFGAASSDTSGSVNSHTYTLGDIPPAGMTMTLQRGTGQVEQFEGTVFQTFKASVSSGEVMQIEMDLIAETSSARGTLVGSGDSTISYTAPTNENLVLHSHLKSPTLLSWDGANIDLISFEFSLENQLNERMRLGQTTTKQPTVTDYRNATITVEFETDDAQYAKFLNDTSGAVQVIFDNGGAGTARRYIQFNLHNAYITEYSDEISETGLVTASVTFKGEGDGTNHGAMIETFNLAADSESDSA